MVIISCFNILVIKKNDAMNLYTQIFLQDSNFMSFGYVFRSRIAGSYSSSILNVLINLHTVNYNRYTISHPHQQGTGCPISPC